MELTIPSAKVVKVVGLLWRIERQVPPSLSDAELQENLRQQLYDHAVTHGAKPDDKGNLPVTLTLPCGESITYPDVKAIPMADVPCSCGDPTHWFVKYEDRSSCLN